MPSPAPRAGGLFIALGLLAGFGGGLWAGAATLGVLVGAVVGIALALLVWLAERRR